ncbi:MAG: DHH family phosphoesterase [Bdellovibrionales bacterium]
MQQLLELLRKSHSITVTTHRDCDGDGVGAMLAFYHALKARGSQVRLLSVDAIPAKYDFLPGYRDIHVFTPDQTPPEGDLLIAFDTNDARRIEPLGSWALNRGHVVFIDHHPVLEKGPHPGHSSFINTQAASTGEMTFELIKSLKIPMNAAIAECLYTSIVFDTQLFRFLRKSPRSHQIAAELMEYDFDPTEIHRRLFGEQTPAKLRFLALALSRIEYLQKDQVAYLNLPYEDFQKHGVDPESSRDVVDMMMNVRNVEIAVVLREDRSGRMKISVRSKGRFEVLSLAELWGGGGHLYAAGATAEGRSFEELRKTLDQWIGSRLR